MKLSSTDEQQDGVKEGKPRANRTTKRHIEQEKEVTNVYENI